jgi:hypothetical protein
MPAIVGCWSRVGQREPGELAPERPPDFSLPDHGSGLEFRILANEADDQEGIQEAARLINQADDGVTTQLKELQEQGLPPPGPRLAAGKKEPKEFVSRVARNLVSRVSYDWVELGPPSAPHCG